jgi:hypothetical protein
MHETVTRDLQETLIAGLVTLAFALIATTIVWSHSGRGDVAVADPAASHLGSLPPLN